MNKDKKNCQKIFRNPEFWIRIFPDRPYEFRIFGYFSSVWCMDQSKSNSFRYIWISERTGTKILAGYRIPDSSVFWIFAVYRIPDNTVFKFSPNTVYRIVRLLELLPYTVYRIFSGSGIIRIRPDYPVQVCTLTLPLHSATELRKCGVLGIYLCSKNFIKIFS